MLAAWLRQVSTQLADGQNGGLTLMIRPQGNKHAEKIKDYVLLPETSLDNLAAEICQDAFDEGQGTGNGVHAFVIHAYRGDKLPFQTKRFLISIDSAPESVSDSVDERSLLAQAQRHAEAREKTILEERRAMWGAMATMFESVVSRLNAHEAQEMSRMQSQIEAVKAHAQAINTVEDHKLDREIKSKAANMAFDVAPMLAGGLAKKLGWIGDDGDAEVDDIPPEPPQIPSVLETNAPVTVQPVAELQTLSEVSKPKSKVKRSKRAPKS
jgi:hypothetical protein